MNSSAKSKMPDFTRVRAPESAVGLAAYFMGTNASGKHLEEALRQQIILPGERVLGFFDGIFFDEENTRVGGMALHDYLIVTDRNLILWARDQFKDYVDRFKLGYCFVLSAAHKDMLHGTVRFGLVLPAVEEAQISKAEQMEVTFDFVPQADIKQIAQLVELTGNVHRDLIAGGAGEADRWKATWVLFNQLFVGREVSASAPRGFDPGHPAYDEGEPLVEIVEGASLDDLVTPLSRLDDLDRPSAWNTPPGQSGRAGEDKLVTFPISRINQGTGPVNPAQLEAELHWLNEGQVYSSGSGSGSQAAPGKSMPKATQVGPGTRLKQELQSQTEGLYTIGRAGRAAWDSIEKFRREGEAKFETRGGITSLVTSLKDSGMNLKDITEFVVAINGLLDTVNRSPAARDLAMTFLNRSSFLSNLGQRPAARKNIPEVEDINEEDELLEPVSGSGSSSKDNTAPAPKTGASNRLKVERRGSAPTSPPPGDPFNPPRYKVAIRKRDSEAEAEAEAEAETESGRAFEAETESRLEDFMGPELEPDVEVKLEAISIVPQTPENQPRPVELRVKKSRLLGHNQEN